MKKQHIIFLFLLFILGSCGTTQIVTHEAEAEIYVDGDRKGTGRAEIIRTGIPKRIEITAEYDGKQIGSQSVRRRFDGATFISGMFTYGLGFIVCWRFPATIFVPTEQIEVYDNEQNKQSIWKRPPGGKWRKSKKGDG